MPRIYPLRSGPSLGNAGALVSFLTNRKNWQATWKTKPTWYIVAGKDRMINPDLQKLFAKKMNAVTLTLDASHVPMLSQPAKVAAFIAEAAKNVNPQ